MITTSDFQPANRPELRIGDRCERTQALEMLGRVPLGELMGMAHRARRQRWPQPVVTFVIDTNPNYTNICEPAVHSALSAVNRKTKKPTPWRRMFWSNGSRRLMPGGRPRCCCRAAIIPRSVSTIG